MKKKGVAMVTSPCVEGSMPRLPNSPEGENLTLRSPFHYESFFKFRRICARKFPTLGFEF